MQHIARFPLTLERSFSRFLIAGSLERHPGYLLAYGVLVASYARLGRLDEVQSALRRLREVHPTLSLTGAQNFIAFVDPTIVQHLTDGLRSAGFKEGAAEPSEF